MRIYLCHSQTCYFFSRNCEPAAQKPLAPVSLTTGPIEGHRDKLPESPCLPSSVCDTWIVADGWIDALSRQWLFCGPGSAVRKRTRFVQQVCAKSSQTKNREQPYGERALRSANSVSFGKSYMLIASEISAVTIIYIYIYIFIVCLICYIVH